MKTSVSIIGSGNMAHELASIFSEVGITIDCIYSRNKKTGRSLAKKFKAKFIDAIANWKINSNFILICIDDRAIEKIIKHLPKTDNIYIHTSGSTNINVFEKHFKNYGVLYPLMSITKNKKTDWSSTPVCIEGNNKLSTSSIQNLAKKISRKVIKIDSVKRSKLHLTAVLVNNFVNALYTMGYDILKEDHLSFTLMHPIIQQTFDKIKANSPAQVQTGPAMRKDVNTIKKHLQLLSGTTNGEKIIYKALSSYINKKHTTD